MLKPPISADIHCVFWAACADTVPALSPLFYGQMVGQRVFLQALVTGIVANRKQKIPSQVIGKIMFKPTGHFYSFRLFRGNL